MRDFSPLVRQSAYVKMLITGLPGSGKSRGCLQLGMELAGGGGTLAIIDTEPNGPSHYYAEFAPGAMRAMVESQQTDEYLYWIARAAELGIDVLIIDGLTPHWDNAQRWHDELAETRFKGNGFAAWGPVQKDCDRLVDAIMAYPGHVLVTAQGKERFKQVGRDIVSQGVLPECRARDPFVFDHTCIVNPDHAVTFAKSRCAVLDRKDFDCMWGALAEVLLGWCRAGVGAQLIADFQRAQRDGDHALYEATKTEASRQTRDGELRGSAKQAVVKAQQAARAALGIEPKAKPEPATKPESAPEAAAPASNGQEHTPEHVRKRVRAEIDRCLSARDEDDMQAAVATLQALHTTALSEGMVTDGETDVALRDAIEALTERVAALEN